MENTLKTLETEGLSIKLTDEKIFITTATSMETFALRSIDGIGVIDLVDQFNSELDKYKLDKKGSVSGMIMTGFFVFCGLIGLIVAGFLGLFLLGIGLILFIPVYLKYQKLIQPTLKSAVRIMMAGGNRDFMFDKAHSNSMEVAEFVAKIEDTLTAFHKK
jgi:hypothetical protein